MSHDAEWGLSRERKRNKRFNCINTDYILLMISEQRWLLSHMWHHLTLIHWRFCLLLLRISRPTSSQPQSRVKLDVIGVGDLPWTTFFPPLSSWFFSPLAPIKSFLPVTTAHFLLTASSQYGYRSSRTLSSSCPYFCNSSPWLSRNEFLLVKTDTRPFASTASYG